MDKLSSDSISFNLKKIHFFLMILTIIISLGSSTGSFVSAQANHEKRLTALEHVSMQRIKILYELKMNLKSYLEREGYKYESLNGDFEKLFEQSEK